MAKFCANCGHPADEQTKFCTNCASNQFTESESNPLTPAYTLNGEQGALPESPEKEKVLLGILGAFLFSLAGGVIYVILYQFGILAAVCGWLAFTFASVGYKLFSKTKEKYSVKSIVVSLVMLFVVILLAEYVSLAIDIYKVFSEDYHITFMTAFLSVPSFLADGEILKAVLGELGFSYVFGFIAVIGNIVNFFKGRKAEKEAVSAPQTAPEESEDSASPEE